MSRAIPIAVAVGGVAAAVHCYCKAKSKRESMSAAWMEKYVTIEDGIATKGFEEFLKADPAFQDCLASYYDGWYYTDASLLEKAFWSGAYLNRDLVLGICESFKSEKIKNPTFRFHGCMDDSGRHPMQILGWDFLYKPDLCTVTMVDSFESQSFKTVLSMGRENGSWKILNKFTAPVASPSSSSEAKESVDAAGTTWAEKYVAIAKEHLKSTEGFQSYVCSDPALRDCLASYYDGWYYEDAALLKKAFWSAAQLNDDPVAKYWGPFEKKTKENSSDESGRWPMQILQWDWLTEKSLCTITMVDAFHKSAFKTLLTLDKQDDEWKILYKCTAPTTLPSSM